MSKNNISNSIQNIQHLIINLIQKVQDLYPEIYKTLLREVREDFSQ
jgi:hypothetical protein